MNKNTRIHAGLCPQCGCTVRLVVQDYWTFTDLAAKFRFAKRSIRDWAAAGEFGPVEQFLRRGNDVRVPTSGVLFFIENNLHKVDRATEIVNQIRAQQMAEGRRKS